MAMKGRPKAMPCSIMRTRFGCESRPIRSASSANFSSAGALAHHLERHVDLVALVVDRLGEEHLGLAALAQARAHQVFPEPSARYLDGAGLFHGGELRNLSWRAPPVAATP